MKNAKFIMVGWLIGVALWISAQDIRTNVLSFEWDQPAGTNYETTAVAWMFYHAPEGGMADTNFEVFTTNATITLVRPYGRAEVFWVSALNGLSVESDADSLIWPPWIKTNIFVWSDAPGISTSSSPLGPWFLATGGTNFSINPSAAMKFFKGTNVSIRLEGARLE